MPGEIISTTDRLRTYVVPFSRSSDTSDYLPVVQKAFHYLEQRREGIEF
jgi:hypothetical protein